MISLLEMFRRNSTGSMAPAPIGLDDEELWLNLDGGEFSVVIPCQEIGLDAACHSADMT
jgi:hypothetical protein